MQEFTENIDLIKLVYVANYIQYCDALIILCNKLKTTLNHCSTPTLSIPAKQSPNSVYYPNNNFIS